MTLGYLDTSAAMKLIVREAETEALLDALAATSDDRVVVASWLLHTELHCASGRHPTAVPLAAVSGVLDRVALFDLIRGDLVAAGLHAPLRGNDAIHLAVAIRLGADEMITYDDELASAAQRAGLTVTSPGRPTSRVE